ncbi:MAG TPA: STAS domain-containing protein [Planctomycetota bacterium]|jgi:anti-anti-sigma regulatory factor
MMHGSAMKSEAPSNPKLTLTAGRLVLNGNLQRSDYLAFQEACHQLQQCDSPAITLDLTTCTYAGSTFIGDLVEAVTQMKTDGKNVIVFVSPELGRLLNLAHLYHLFSYTIIDPRLQSE